MHNFRPGDLVRGGPPFRRAAVVLRVDPNWFAHVWRLDTGKPGIITIDPRFSFVVHHQVLLTSRKKHHYSANNIRLAGFEPTADECAVLMKHMLLDY
jgi:hypothetical protein